MVRHILSLADLEPKEILHLVDRSLRMEQGYVDGEYSLRGKMVGIYFRKTSTRTRTSFTVGAAKLGAIPIVYGPNDLQTNTGETIRDTARVLSGYLDALVMRTAETMAEMQTYANQNKMAVINAMSEFEHPTQALADLMTIRQYFGRLNGIHILYLGEGNNTAAALALGVSKIRGMRLTLLTPKDYGVPEGILGQAVQFGQMYDAVVEQYHDLANLPKAADVVYATRWQTTGTSKADPDWKHSFEPFKVTTGLLAKVANSSGTVFMHDLPAVRGEDVEPDVLDGPQSIAFQQARNKLFSAMAALEWCLRDG